MPVIDLIKNIGTSIRSGRIPYNYKVGSKSKSSLPVDVKLSLDQDFKKTIVKSVTIFAVGTALGIAAGIVISKSKGGK
jgi:hypothetical protein